MEIRYNQTNRNLAIRQIATRERERESSTRTARLSRMTLTLQISAAAFFLQTCYDWKKMHGGGQGVPLKLKPMKK